MSRYTPQHLSLGFKVVTKKMDTVGNNLTKEVKSTKRPKIKEVITTQHNT